MDPRLVPVDGAFGDSELSIAELEWISVAIEAVYGVTISAPDLAKLSVSQVQLRVVAELAVSNGSEL